MRDYYAYVRVSTVKQGERGSSLQEQKSAIEAYAKRHGLPITVWFEEMETAAKEGRRLFNRMVADLTKGKAAGVIVHKIDRSARNLKDWSQINDLMDAGVEVHFAHESLDMGTRGGRLSADIQAVVAADYIRNLRDEVKKGIYGRLKQGLYPLPAPRGYLDRGKGKRKEIDPVSGPLVRQAFELYGSGAHTLETLRMEMHRRGLRSRAGQPLGLEAISVMLRNPFYCGLIRIRRTGQTFEGVHQPLVTKAVFDRVQAVLEGRVFARPQKHSFLFRRLIRCAACGYSLIGESRKGHTYYRCHTRTCRGTILKEPEIDRMLRERLALLRFTEEEVEAITRQAQARSGDQEVREEQRTAGLKRDLARCDDRLARLTDALVDGLLDKETFELRKTALFEERRSLRDGLEAKPAEETFAETVVKYLGRANTAYELYESGFPDEKREMVKSLTSDFLARGKTLQITMQNVLETIIQARFSAHGAPCPGLPRTMGTLYAPGASSDPVVAPPAVARSRARSERAEPPERSP
jgi:site-specific DNA recombinase